MCTSLPVATAKLEMEENGGNGFLGGLEYVEGTDYMEVPEATGGTDLLAVLGENEGTNSTDVQDLNDCENFSAERCIRHFELRMWEPPYRCTGVALH